tara:strand:+ start:1303 stop:1659 length:357 start_codon:yes stop_codon:yes gene_type:complete
LLAEGHGLELSPAQPLAIVQLGASCSQSSRATTGQRVDLEALHALPSAVNVASNLPTALTVRTTLGGLLDLFHARALGFCLHLEPGLTQLRRCWPVARPSQLSFNKYTSPVLSLLQNY